MLCVQDGTVSSRRTPARRTTSSGPGPRPSPVRFSMCTLDTGSPGSDAGLLAAMKSLWLARSKSEESASTSSRPADA